MKMIVAVVRPEALEDVKAALFKAEIHKMTVFHVKGCGQQKGYTESYRGNIVNVNLLNKVCMEIVVNDKFVDSTVESILNTFSTGKTNIFPSPILPVLAAFIIRTGEEGIDAIG